MANTAAVTVPASWLSEGHLPPVSMKTGQPANDRVKVSATYISPVGRGLAAVSFFLLGLIGVLIVLAVAQKKVRGRIAVESSARFRNLNLAGFGVLVVAVLGALGIDAAGLDQALGAAVLIIGLLTAVGLFVLGARKTGGAKLALSKDKQLVTISKVHPGFVAAVQTLLAGPVAPVAEFDPTIPFAPSAAVQNWGEAVPTGVR